MFLISMIFAILLPGCSTSKNDDTGAGDTVPSIYEPYSGTWNFDLTAQDDGCNSDPDDPMSMDIEVFDDKVVLFAGEDYEKEAVRDGNTFSDKVYDGFDLGAHGIDCEFSFEYTYDGEFTSNETMVYSWSWSTSNTGSDCDEVELSNEDDETIPVPCTSSADWDGFFYG